MSARPAAVLGVLPVDSVRLTSLIFRGPAQVRGPVAERAPAAQPMTSCTIDHPAAALVADPAQVISRFVPEDDPVAMAFAQVT